jgi:hypothetical protein
VSRDDLKKAENQVALQVHTLYYGILTARLQKQAAEQQSTYGGEQLRESEDDIRNGSALRIAAIQGRAGLLESQQSVLTADLQLADLTTELNDLLGLPLGTRLDLDPAVPASLEERPREEYVQTAWSENPEILAGQEVVRKARSGCRTNPRILAGHSREREDDAGRSRGRRDRHRNRRGEWHGVGVRDHRLHGVVAGLENSRRGCGPRDLDGRAPFVSHNPLVQCLQKRLAGGPLPERCAGAVPQGKIVFLP